MQGEENFHDLAHTWTPAPSSLFTDWEAEQPALVAHSWKHLGDGARRVMNSKPAWTTCETLSQAHTHTH